MLNTNHFFLYEEYERGRYVENLINIRDYPIYKLLDTLLKDKTTQQNIIWATDGYFEDGKPIDPKKQITIGTLLGINAQELQPRVMKSIESQADRTKSKAEVFTPCWIVNKMNNHCDEEWFGRPNVFNTEGDQSWIVNEEKIQFPDSKHWTDYITSSRLEITCGEAPYLVSRYDTTTGEVIPIKRRIGILDRKLRVVNENTTDELAWMEWVTKAFQATYGYEFQGDNLIIARINMLMTFFEYYTSRWESDPKQSDLRKIANIIAWNIWQMDGLTGCTPLGKPVGEFKVISLFEEESVESDESVPCKIYDWRANRSILFNSLKGNV